MTKSGITTKVMSLFTHNHCNDSVDIGNGNIAVAVDVTSQASIIQPIDKDRYQGINISQTNLTVTVHVCSGGIEIDTL